MRTLLTILFFLCVIGSCSAIAGCAYHEGAECKFSCTDCKEVELECVDDRQGLFDRVRGKEDAE